MRAHLLKLLLILIVLWAGAITSASAEEFSQPDRLTEYPFNQLLMVGTINNQQQIWGIIRTPRQEIYRVAVGNELGVEHAQVLEITSQRITARYLLKNGQMGIKTLWLKCD